MKELEIGEWIKGPFANATIEGFITGKDKDSYIITVKTIEEPVGKLPDYLRVGSCFILPKIVLHEFFRSLNKEQQQNIILLAKHLNNYQWAVDLANQFYNPFVALIDDTQNSENYVSSDVLCKHLGITEEERSILFNYYQEARQGFADIRITTPEHITTETIDAVIAAIVLLYDCPDGISFIKRLKNKYETTSFSEM